MTYYNIHDPAYYWDNNFIKTEPRGKYIAISGNSCSGKSSTLNLIEEIYRKSEQKCVFINEQVLYHPFFKLMFQNPNDFSFEIQMHIHLQRCLLLKKWLLSGFNVFIERSHLEDEIFFNDHKDKGHLSQLEIEAYSIFKQTVGLDLPIPDVIIYLKVPLEELLFRIEKSESLNERPCEYPDRSTKVEYFKSWEIKINKHIRLLKNKYKIKVHDIDFILPPESYINDIKCIVSKILPI